MAAIVAGAFAQPAQALDISKHESDSAAVNAIQLKGGGYPNRYTATAEYLIPRIIETPPGARAVWVYRKGDIITDKWVGKTVVDREAAALCRPDEWLLVEAWDES